MGFVSSQKLSFDLLQLKNPSSIFIGWRAYLEVLLSCPASRKERNEVLCRSILNRIVVVLIRIKPGLVQVLQSDPSSEISSWLWSIRSLRFSWTLTWKCKIFQAKLNSTFLHARFDFNHFPAHSGLFYQTNDITTSISSALDYPKTQSRLLKNLDRKIYWKPHFQQLPRSCFLNLFFDKIFFFAKIIKIGDKFPKTQLKPSLSENLGNHWYKKLQQRCLHFRL